MSDAKSGGRSRPVVMSVDDDPMMQRVIERYLVNEGYDAVFASDGKKALKELKTEKPDVILLDVMMPGMDGYEVCSTLQSNPDTAYIPVIFATALGEERDKARAFAVGAADYLVKPFKKDALLEKVAAHVKTRDDWKRISKAETPPKTSKSSDGRDFGRFKEFLTGLEVSGGKPGNGLASASPGDIYAACSRLGIKSGVVAQHIAEFLKLPYVSSINPKDVMLGVLPTRFCKANRIVALADVTADMAFVVCNPFDWQLNDVLASIGEQGHSYRMIITEPENIDWLFEIADATGKEVGRDEVASIAFRSADVDELAAAPEEPDRAEVDDLANSAQKAPIIKLANALISRAVHSQASDIHVEPRESSVGIRYRMDGMLQEADPVPKKLQGPLVSRLKIMAGMDIAERRLPQDGRIRINFRGRNIDLRVSTLPSRFGEKVVIRVLDSTAVSLDFDALGFDSRSLELFRRSITRPHGIILVTGPTGSGKSTTLYTALQAINEPTRNIVTVEDPIEYEMHRITQVQVHPDIGLDFPSALRSILRQDPDVIMLGEIRDRETMDIAVRAALTGHLVLSTLHTNGAANTVVRLVDMGMEPYLVAAALEMVVAQRLLRRLCPDCKQPAEQPADDAFSKYDIKKDKSMQFFKPVGCNRCGGTGYRGRLAALEVMPVDGGMRELINKNAGAEMLLRYSVEQHGMTTLQQSAFIRASQGLTSMEEAMRVTG